jgi:hypothetical protein
MSCEYKELYEKEDRRLLEENNYVKSFCLIERFLNELSENAKKYLDERDLEKNEKL